MIEQGGTTHGGEQLNDGEILYVCPPCGVVVSNYDPAAMRLHHMHVINPVQLDRTAETFRNRMQAEQAQNDLHQAKHALLG